MDITSETAVVLADVPKLPMIPRRRWGKRLNIATVHRWCTVGVRGVRLEYLQVGGTRVTTVEALVRFFAALTEVDRVDAPPPVVEVGHRTDQIDKDLDAAWGRTSTPSALQRQPPRQPAATSKTPR